MMITSGVTCKCDLHLGSPIQTSTDGIAGCSRRDNLSLVMTLLFFPSKMEGNPSKERFVNQPPNTAGTTIYGDSLYGNLYVIPVCYVELGIEILSIFYVNKTFIWQFLHKI